MAEHEVKEQDKSDELVDMIEKLMEDGSGSSHDFRRRSHGRGLECEDLSQHGLLEGEHGLLSAD